MIHLLLPFTLAAILAASGTYGILARRNAVLVLVGVELVLASASLLLVTMSATLPDEDSAGQVLTLFVITLAAAEVALALGIVLAAYRLRGHIDVTEPLEASGSPEVGDADTATSARRSSVVGGSTSLDSREAGAS